MIYEFLITTKNASLAARQIVKKQYKELMDDGLPFLQIFPGMIQETNIAQTFKRRRNERNKSVTQDMLDEKTENINKFRENLFLYWYVVPYCRCARPAACWALNSSCAL